MIFFKYKTLAKMLHNNEVTQKQQMIYLLLITILYTINSTSLLGDYFYNNAAELNLYDYIIDATAVFFVILITILAYIQNSKGDNKHYISRSICLTLPVLMLTFPIAFLFGIPAGLLDSIVFYNLEPNAPDFAQHTGPFLVSSIIAMYAVYTHLFINGFKIASGQKDIK